MNAIFTSAQALAASKVAANLMPVAMRLQRLMAPPCVRGWGGGILTAAAHRIQAGSWRAVPDALQQSRRRTARRTSMQGLMMQWPLMISSLIRHADRCHGDTEIVSRTVEGPVHRYTYRDAHARARRLANALARLGVGPGECVATIAWNGYRHFELYYAISGTGAVVHTINPRLFHEQLVYILDHAGDRAVFFDLTFLPLAERLA